MKTKTTVKSDADLLAKLEQLVLHHGSHGSFEQGHCAMEVVARLANEPHSDKPKCACPVISRFVINWNDRMKTDEERTAALRPLLPCIVGSKSTKAVERKRAWMCADWAVRDSAPAWLDWSATTSPGACSTGSLSSGRRSEPGAREGEGSSSRRRGDEGPRDRAPPGRRGCRRRREPRTRRSRR